MNPLPHLRRFIGSTFGRLAVAVVVFVSVLLFLGLHPVIPGGDALLMLALVCAYGAFALVDVVGTWRRRSLWGRIIADRPLEAASGVVQFCLGGALVVTVLLPRPPGLAGGAWVLAMGVFIATLVVRALAHTFYDLRDARRRVSATAA